MQTRLYELAQLAKKRVQIGYYDSTQRVSRPHSGLVEAIFQCKKNPIISEIKYASPSSGKIRDPEPASRIARQMLQGGACALSILTDPITFQGGLHILSRLAKTLRTPLIMKDIIVSPRQLLAASQSGADAVVLISELFSQGLGEVDLASMVKEARHLGLETLVEANGIDEFKNLQRYGPDLYGVNNRDLSTFRVDLGTTTSILSQTSAAGGLIVSESGIETASDVIGLRNSGANAFLVGTSIMKSPNIKAKVRELVNA